MYRGTSAWQGLLLAMIFGPGVLFATVYAIRALISRGQVCSRDRGDCSRMPRSGRSILVLRGVGWLGAAGAAQAGLKIALVVLLARLLTPADYGLMALATAVVAIAEILTRMGVDQALVQRQTVSEAELASAATFGLLAALVGTSCLLLFAPVIAKLFGPGQRLAELIQVLALSLVINSLGTVPRALLTRQGRFRYLGISEFGAFLISSLVAALPMAYASMGVWALATAYLAQATLATVFLLAAGTSTVTLSMSRCSVSGVLRYGGMVTGAKLANFAGLQADNLILGMFLGEKQLGAYTRAYALNAMPATLLGQAIERALFPVMSQSQQDFPALRRGLRRGVYGMLFAFAPITAYCYSFAEPIVLLLLGSSWTDAVAPFQMLSLSMYFRLAYKLPEVTLRAVGRVTTNLVINIIYAALIVAAALIGVQFGTQWLALGVSVAIAAHYLQALVVVSRLVRLTMWPLALAHFTAACVVVGLVVVLNWVALRFSAATGELGILIISGVIVALVHGVGIVIWRAANLMRVMAGNPGSDMRAINDDEPAHL